MIEKILAILSALVLIFVVGAIVYTEYSWSEVTVVIDLRDNEDPFVALKEIMPDQSSITHIHEFDKSKNEYVITMSTKHKRSGVLSWVTNNNKVENARLKD